MMIGEISEFVQPVAFLPGLLLVIALAVVALGQGRQARSWLFPAAIPVSLLSVTCPIVINAIVYINAFQAIASTGSGGALVIADLSLSVCRSVLFGVIGLAGCLCLIALVYVVAGRMRPGTAPPVLRPASAALGVVFSLTSVVLTLGTGLLVWLQLTLIDTITLVSDPRTSQAAMEAAVGAGGIGAVSERLSHILQVLTFGGIPFSLLLVGVAVAAIVLLLRRQPARIGALVAAGVLVVAGAGSVWAIVRLNASMREINRVASAAAATPADRFPDSALQIPPPEPPPEPPPPSQQPLRVGGNITAPIQTKHVEPVYPEIARAARVQGIVTVDTTIGPNGKVQDAWVLRSIPLLDQAAIEAVRQWEFAPTLVNGVPVPVIMTVTVTFSLQ